MTTSMLELRKHKNKYLNLNTLVYLRNLQVIFWDSVKFASKFLGFIKKYKFLHIQSYFNGFCNSGGPDPAR